MRRRACSAASSSSPSFRMNCAISRQLKDTLAAASIRNIRASRVRSIGPRAVNRTVEPSFAVEAFRSADFAAKEQRPSHGYIAVVGSVGDAVPAARRRHEGDAVENQRPPALHSGVAKEVLLGQQSPEDRRVRLVRVHSPQVGEVAPAKLGVRYLAGKADGDVATRPAWALPIRSAGCSSRLRYGHSPLSLSVSPNRNGRPLLPRIRPSNSPSALTRAL